MEPAILRHHSSGRSSLIVIRENGTQTQIQLPEPGARLRGMVRVTEDRLIVGYHGAHNVGTRVFGIDLTTGHKVGLGSYLQDVTVSDIQAQCTHLTGLRLHEFRPVDVECLRLPPEWRLPVSYTHLRAHETVLDLVC